MVEQLTQEQIDKRLFHEIHVSEIREFLKCQWAWDWKYNQQMYPRKGSAKPLEFGTAMHAGMEQLYNPEYFHDKQVCEGLAISKINSTIDEQLANALANIELLFGSKEDIILEYEERRSLATNMLKYYVEVIGPSEAGFEPLMAEQEFMLRVPFVCNCKKCADKCGVKIGTEAWINWSGLPVVIEGKIDLVLKDHGGQVWVRDWKNVASLYESMEWLELDIQLLIYLWALWEMGLDIGGFQYFEQKKIVPQAPEPLKRKTGGCAYSRSRTAPHEFKSYLATIIQHDAQAYTDGLYDEYLDWLRLEGPQYHRLTVVRKDSSAMQQVQAIVYKYVQSITQQRVLPTLVPTPTKFNCTYCEFRQVCIEKMNGDDWETMLTTLFEQKKHYYDAQREGEVYG